MDFRPPSAILPVLLAMALEFEDAPMADTELSRLSARHLAALQTHCKRGPHAGSAPAHRETAQWAINGTACASSRPLPGHARILSGITATRRLGNARFKLIDPVAREPGSRP